MNCDLTWQVTGTGRPRRRLCKISVMGWTGLAKEVGAAQRRGLYSCSSEDWPSRLTGPLSLNGQKTAPKKEDQGLTSLSRDSEFLRNSPSVKIR